MGAFQNKFTNLKNKRVKSYNKLENEEKASIERKMDFFYGPYRNDLLKQHDAHMRFEQEKNPQWASIADGIIGK